jgi:hypothetical protein
MKLKYSLEDSSTSSFSTGFFRLLKLRDLTRRLQVKMLENTLSKVCVCFHIYWLIIDIVVFWLFSKIYSLVYTNKLLTLQVQILHFLMSNMDFTGTSYHCLPFRLLFIDTWILPGMYWAYVCSRLDFLLSKSATETSDQDTHKKS